MKEKQLNVWLIVALIIVLLAAVLSMIFGQGELNLGSLKLPKTKVARTVKKVAMVECPGRAEPKEGFCIYTAEWPLEYYVVKEGSSYTIYGPVITQLYKDLGINNSENAVLPASTYAVTEKGFDLSFSYRVRDSIDGKVPSFVLENPDQAIIDQFKSVRFIELKVSDTVKIRLNTFKLPTKETTAG